MLLLSQRSERNSTVRLLPHAHAAWPPSIVVQAGKPAPQPTSGSAGASPSHDPALDPDGAAQHGSFLSSLYWKRERRKRPILVPAAERSPSRSGSEAHDAGISVRRLLRPPLRPAA